MNIERTIGNADQQTQQGVPAFEESATTVDTFEGMSPGWALEWDLTTLSGRNPGAGDSVGGGARTGGGIRGSNDQ